MPAWFDIYGLTMGAQEDALGIHRACQSLAFLIEEETRVHGILPSNIAVGGFSQGGAVALHTCFVHGYLKETIGAVVGLSCWLPLGASIIGSSRRRRGGGGGGGGGEGEGGGGEESPIVLSEKNRETPLFMGHGMKDSLVRCEYGEMTSNVLTRQDLTFQTYRGIGHETCTTELQHVRTFLLRVLLHG